MAWERTVAVYKFALARHRLARSEREERQRERGKERARRGRRACTTPSGMSNACSLACATSFPRSLIPQRRSATHCTKLIQCGRVATSRARLNANNASRAQQLIAAAGSALPDVRAPDCHSSNRLRNVGLRNQSLALPSKKKV